MQTSLQSFKSSQKVNILDGTTEKKLNRCKKVGSVIVAFQSQRKPFSLSATKRRWDLHLRSLLLTKMKKISSVLLQINIKSAFDDILRIVVILKYLLKHNVNPWIPITNHIIESGRISQLNSNYKLHNSKECNALEKALN